MARDRSIIVRLRAEVSDFKREMNAAADAARKVGKDAESSGKGAQTVLGGLVRSATENRDAWNTTGTALASFGAVVTGIGVAALKTGIEYNTLQQTTRAALTTLLGSAQAANAQMDKLDEFARTSPFAKQVFIQAQQQLIGFGYAAEDVVPILDAIQNAVAATGGSNQDIAELADVVAKVGAEGKLTAVHLQQFGKRGIEAADLIGQGMGKTGAQIREEITAGTLDADAAIVALTEGMQANFGGAAAGVKETFAGATDRVTAAWRDMTAQLAKPLVDPDGGGILIDFMNRIADVMRAIESLPEPAKIAVGALGGFVGVGALAAGSFLLLFPRVIETYKAFQTLSTTAPRAAAALGKIGKAAGPIALAITALTTLNTVMNKLGEVKLPEWDLVDFEKAIIDIADGTDTVSGSLDQFFEVAANQAKVPWDSTVRGLDGFGEALDRVANKDIQDKLYGFFSFIPSITDADYQHAVDGFNSIDESLANMVSSGNADEAAAAWEKMAQRAEAAGYSTEELTELFPQYEAALQSAENQTRLAEGATDAFAGASHRSQAALKRERDAMLEKTRAYMEDIEAVKGAMDASIGYEIAVMDATAAIKDNNKIMKDAEKGSEEYRRAELDNEKQLLDVTSAFDKKIDAMIEDGATQAELNEATRITREEFVELARDAGDTAIEAEKLADKLGLIPGKYTADIEAETRAAQRTVDEFIRTNDGRTIRLRTTNVVSTTNAEVIRIPGVRGGGLTRADGGHIPYGLGGPREDNVPAWLSSGEFVVNESATRKHRALLEAINQDRVPGFADGGPVASSWGASPTLSIPAPVMSAAAAPSLAGLVIEGTLETSFGPAQVRGVVRQEISDGARRLNAGVRA